MVESTSLPKIFDSCLILQVEVNRLILRFRYQRLTSYAFNKQVENFGEFRFKLDKRDLHTVLYHGLPLANDVATNLGYTSLEYCKTKDNFRMDFACILLLHSTAHHQWITQPHVTFRLLRSLKITFAETFTKFVY